MTARKPPSPFRRFISSLEIIRLAVLMYVRLPLSLRNVRDLLAQRASMSATRRCASGGTASADVRRREPEEAGGSHLGLHAQRWHLDEVYVRFNGVQHYFRRLVDHEGEVLESFVTKERDKAAALKFIKEALKRHGSPKVITTDGLRSYGAAMRELGCEEKREVGSWANNWAEHSHQPFDDENGPCSASGG